MNSGLVFERLLHIAQKNNMQIKFVSFEASNRRLKGDRIGIRMDMTMDDINYTIAHELAHLYLHHDKGDTILSINHEEYEDQADRAAKLLLDAVSVA